MTISRARTLLPLLAAAAVVTAFGIACARFVWQPGLASFADDSVSYLILGQGLSPWAAPGAVVAEGFGREAFYPPLFPLLLGLTGAAFDVAWAHVLCALLVAAALAAQYALAARWLPSRGLAAMAVAATALLPSLWINAKGVLSEPLFMLLLLTLLLALERAPRARARIAALMAALVLTRSIALPMVVAQACGVLLRAGRRWRDALPALAPAGAALAAYAAWRVLRPQTHDEYAQFAGSAAHWVLGADDALAALAYRIVTGAGAIADAWFGALLLFWSPFWSPQLVLAGAIGLLALLGGALRLRAGAADGWMMLAYFAVLVAWPFPGQMTRFLFPVLPLLVLYAMVGLTALLPARGRAQHYGVGLVALVLAALAGPALGFVAERARLGAAAGYAAMTEWYRFPDLREAQARAEIHLGLFADLAAIRAQVGPGERVMWVAPGYVELLADRRAVPAPPEEAGIAAYREVLARVRPDLLFLSAYHPRSTVSDAAWRVGLIAATEAGWQPVYRRASPDGVVRAMLLRPPAAAP